MLAGVGSGLYRSLEDAAVMRRGVKRFGSKMDAATRNKRLEGWAAALAKVL